MNPKKIDNIERETQLLSAVLKSVKANGIEVTIEVLNITADPEIKNQDPIIEFVTRSICSYFRHSLRYVVEKNTKESTRTLALSFMVYYLYDVFGYGYGDLKKLFRRDKAYMCRKKNELLEKFDSEKEIVIKRAKSRFDELVSEYKIKNQLP